jgi:hypothetical protein
VNHREPVAWTTVRPARCPRSRRRPSTGADACTKGESAPSDHEPCGLVVNEAMLAGVLPVASDRVGCAGDLLRATGYIYRAETPARWRLPCTGRWSRSPRSTSGR